MAEDIVFVSPEAAPFAKTGGLADVAGALPVALKALGCNVTLIHPLYREVRASGARLEKADFEVSAPVGERLIKGGVFRGDLEAVDVFFIECDEFFDRTYLYGTEDRDYFDNLERFSFFSRAALEVIKTGRIKADVIHSNDWQTGLVSAYLKDIYAKDPHFANTASVFTIHNMAYQGIFPAGQYNITGLSPALFSPEGLEFWGRVNFLKAGITFSDAITTVSTTYAKEIQTPENGNGLEGVLLGKKDRLYGILNGADYKLWNPEKDALIPANFSVNDLDGKSSCKRSLLKKFGLKSKKAVPVLGIVARLTEQKGFDILLEAMTELMDNDIRLVILGAGEARYKRLIEEEAKKYPDKLSFRFGFDVKLSHLVMAGSDIFLMPSKFEPCGLNQIYCMKYGTIPIVRRTGGLNDTVRDVSTGQGATGFKFAGYSKDALLEKFREAVSIFRDKEAWDALIRNAMKGAFSWQEAAKKYIEVYGKASKPLSYGTSTNASAPPARPAKSP
ncbi:MAG: glycogen synthase GlgA [Deltaproteobacteria bacterium]|nr:glycogen synthase GlgA [Deltaproteobacteria bacterium]